MLPVGQEMIDCPLTIGVDAVTTIVKTSCETRMSAPAAMTKPLGAADFEFWIRFAATGHRTPTWPSRFANRGLTRIVSPVGTDPRLPRSDFRGREAGGQVPS
jgi:hypothetical protein